METKNIKRNNRKLFELLENLKVYDLIKYIEKNPGDINEKNKNGITPLMIALDKK